MTYRAVYEYMIHSNLRPWLKAQVPRAWTVLPVFSPVTLTVCHVQSNESERDDADCSWFQSDIPPREIDKLLVQKLTER
jgi:hypothetical protein